MTAPRINRLRAIQIGAPGLPQQASFFCDVWGLRPAARAGGAVYLRGTGPEHHIVALHDRPKRGIVSIDFAIDGDDAVDALHARLEAAGHRVAAPYRLTTPGGGYGVDMFDPDGRRLRAIAGVSHHNDTRDDNDHPRKLSHIVLNSPQLDQGRDFFCDVLGFRVSDWLEDQMVFMRCARDHHSVALSRLGHASLNHVAFEMAGIDAYMRGIGRMKRSGKAAPDWGPGRHGPGNNPFAYFVVPGDFVFEFTSELQQIDEASHQPRVWRRVPEQSDLWGTAGPPTPEIRAVMAGEPDPNFAS